jgi:hypothetical protein
MKIKYADYVTVFYLETDEEGCNNYMRRSANDWFRLMGESWERVYDCEELEQMFQEWLQVTY